jgi:hypothetical protein
MADTSVARGASIDAAASFGPFTHAGLEQLIGGEAEEVRDAVEVLELNFPLAVQEFIDPGLVVGQPTREVGL